VHKAFTTLKHDVSKRYRPGDGMLSNEEDRVRILEMTRIAREQWPEQKVGFFEGYPYTGGAGGGLGKQIDRQGTIYEGEFQNGFFHGQGKQTLPTGTTLAGEFHYGSPHGRLKQVIDFPLFL